MEQFSFHIEIFTNNSKTIIFFEIWHALSIIALSKNYNCLLFNTLLLLIDIFSVSKIRHLVISQIEGFPEFRFSHSSNGKVFLPYNWPIFHRLFLLVTLLNCFYKQNITHFIVINIRQKLQYLSINSYRKLFVLYCNLADKYFLSEI